MIILLLLISCHLLEDTKYIFSAPSRWDGKDWLVASSLVLGTGAIMLNDENIQDFIQQNSCNTLADISRPFGDGLVTLGIVGGMYISGKVFDNKKLEKTATLSLESFIISAGITNCIKIITGRARSDKGEGASSWHGLGLESKYWSFPSGHSAVAFAMASVIESRYESPVIDFIAYGMAALVAWSRLNDNAHWTSDVVVGAIIGISVGKAISNRHSNR